MKTLLRNIIISWIFLNRNKIKALKLFTGEIKPNFKTNRILVIADILKGRSGITADWVLVARYEENKNETDWILKDINTVMNFFGSGEIKISPTGSRLLIGKIGMQRKGGTPDPESLQFKINPCELFKLNRKRKNLTQNGCVKYFAETPQ